MRDKVITLTEQEFHALYGLVLDRYQASLKPDFEGVSQWHDVNNDKTITIEDLLALWATYV